MLPIKLDPVDSINITMLMDNVSDSLLQNEGLAKRVGFSADAPVLSAPLTVHGTSVDALLAEHGFSALVEVTRNGINHRILFSAGVTPYGV